MLAQIDTPQKTNARTLVQQMVPVLQPPDNPAGPRVFRPLFEGHDASPLNVFYAKTTPNQQTYLMEDVFAEAEMSRKKLETICLNNWWNTHKNLVWEIFPGQSGNTPILSAKSNSYVVSTILLSPGHLKGMHKHFGDEMVFLGVPDRFTVLAHNDSAVLSSLVDEMYKEAFLSGTQLSPYVFVSQNGQVVGYAARDGDEADEDEKVEYPEELLLAIQALLCHAFLMVSIADEEPDDGEIPRFVEALDQLAGTGHTAIHRACEIMNESNLAVLEEVLQSGAERAAMIMLDDIRLARKSLSEEDFQFLKSTTLEIARKVAAPATAEQDDSAPQISKNEQDALDLIEGLFHIA